MVKAAVLAAESGTGLVVKSPRIGPKQSRAVVTEQIVSHLGLATAAPVSEVFTVDVPQELVDLNPAELAVIGAGICHGSKRIANASERARFEHIHVPANRERFAAIAVLYGWLGAAGHQLICDLAPPYRVHSVDHGLFFAGGQIWSEATLHAAPRALCDQTIVAGCKLSMPELRPAIEKMRLVSPEVIAEAVSRCSCVPAQLRVRSNKHYAFNGDDADPRPQTALAEVSNSDALCPPNLAIQLISRRICHSNSFVTQRRIE